MLGLKSLGISDFDLIRNLHCQTTISPVYEDSGRDVRDCRCYFGRCEERCKQNKVSIAIQPAKYVLLTLNHACVGWHRQYVHRKPVMTSTTIDELASDEKVKLKVLMKCENFQKVGGK